MASNFPMVSICIPTYNGAEFIAEALQSAINQSYPNLEIIISDDASSDNTVAIVTDILETTKIPFFIHHHTPQGIGENWNNCVRNANGDYIKFLFQDDVLNEKCVEKMMQLCLQNKKIGLVYSKRNIIYDANNLKHKQWILRNSNVHKNWNSFKVSAGYNNGTKYLKDKNLLNMPENKIGEPTAVLLKKDCFKRIGFFDTKLKQCLDFEYWYRLMKYYKIGFIDEELVSFRLHPNQASFTNNFSFDYEMNQMYQSFYKTIFWQLHPSRQWKLFKKFSILGNLVRYFKRETRKSM